MRRWLTLAHLTRCGGDRRITSTCLLGVHTFNVRREKQCRYLGKVHRTVVGLAIGQHNWHYPKLTHAS